MTAQERQIIQGVIDAFQKAHDASSCDEDAWGQFVEAGDIKPLVDVLEE